MSWLYNHSKYKCMKDTKVEIPLFLSLIIALIALGWYFSFLQNKHDISQLSVSTDRQEYRIGDIVRISIQNLGDRSTDIYCPEWCALGNFPTTLEKFSGHQWKFFAGFCPSIEPLFGGYLHKGDYIVHALSAGSTFKLELSNFEALHLLQDEKLRIVYYLDAGKVPIYSNEFTLKP